MSTHKDLRRALNGFQDLVRRLNATPFSAPESMSLSGMVMLSDPKLGGLTLTGREREHYVQVASSLYDAVSDGDVLSRRQVGHLLNRGVLRALDVNGSFLKKTSRNVSSMRTASFGWPSPPNQGNGRSISLYVDWIRVGTRDGWVR